MGGSLRGCALFATAFLILTACGGSQPPIDSSDMAARSAVRHRQKFDYTGKPQSFTVPAGVTEITVVAQGAGCPSYGSRGTRPSWVGSNGGLLKATIPVTPGETLGIYVGGAGVAGTNGGGGTGGFNGGASGGAGPYGGNYSDGGEGGGGASDVREGSDRLKDRVLVAAGGGGGGVAEGFYGAGEGGDGGGLAGSAGSGGSSSGGYSGKGGEGGTQTAGGSGGPGASGSHNGAPGRKGKRGAGGAAGAGTKYTGGGGGGGGGGYYGGGGGGAGSRATSGVGGGGGGGGGSSYVEATATHVKTADGGATNGNGRIVISW
jgi:hypothetical protein